MAKDPICGMTVDEATALHAERDGETFYFCGEQCRKEFLSKNPSNEHDGGGGAEKSERHDHAAPGLAHQAVVDNPDLIVACCVGDAEAETAPLATSWQSNKLLDPINDGGEMPV